MAQNWKEWTEDDFRKRAQGIIEANRPEQLATDRIITILINQARIEPNEEPKFRNKALSILNHPKGSAKKGTPFLFDF